MTADLRASGPASPAPAARPGLLGIWALDLIYTVIVLIPLKLYTLWQMVAKGRHRRSWFGKWGFGLARATRGIASGGIWVHAVSVGEARAALPVVEALQCRYPGTHIQISTTTETGQDTARKIFPGLPVLWFPYDISFNIARWFRRLQPRLIILMEGDLWPNFNRLAARRGIPVVLVNGKISDRTARRYARAMRSPLAPLTRAMWRPLRAVCVQSELDRERCLPMVSDPSALHVTGNVKFDFTPPPITDDQRAQWRTHLGLKENQPVIIAGSTHPTEETLLVHALGAVRLSHPETHLIIVPRHPERFGDVVHEMSETGLRVQRWTHADGTGAHITVVDEMGLLQSLYSLATVAVVGGSFVDVGGHNILEPAAFGVPVVFGPHMHAQRAMRMVLLDAKGGLQVAPDDLGQVLTELIGDESRRRRLGENGRAAVQASQGSAERCVEIIDALLR
jgi:3-deoxy-D-manno-octulosonic-acid transferase